MSHSVFGRDLPPGCRVSGIPGNRPEDQERKAIYDGFFDKKRLTKTKDDRYFSVTITDKEYKLMDELYADNKYSETVDNYIMAAIEYGIEIGHKQQQSIQEERANDDYNYRKYERNPVLRLFFKKQRQLIKDLQTKIDFLLKSS